MSEVSTRLELKPVGVYSGTLDALTASQLQEAAAELESLGYGALWTGEVAGRDPFVTHTMVLAATSTLVGATGIANIWARDAVAMTEGAKALTEAFPERFILGLGVSHRTLVSDLRGHDYAKPLSAMRTYLASMDESPYQGFRPTTQVRRVLAALRPKMQELAAEQTDGIHPYLVPVEHTSEARERLGTEPLICPEQAVLLEPDPARARRIARAHLDVYLGLPNYVGHLADLGFGEDDLTNGYSDRLVDAIVAWGSLEQIASRVQAHLDAGADHVAIQALTEGPREVPVDQWRELAPVMAELRSSVA